MRKIYFLVLLFFAALTFTIRLSDSWKSSETVYYDTPELFFEYEQLIRTKDGDSIPRYVHNYQTRELNRLRSTFANARTRNAYAFKERGPSNVPGRTRTVKPSPLDDDVWLAATVGGGIWKSENGGQSWVNTSGNLPNLSTTSIAYATSNPSVIYAGTGETFAASNLGGNGINGSGLYKSLDGGNSWASIPSTAEDPRFGNINRVIVHPSSEDTLMAATSTGLINPTLNNLDFGIQKSTDGGETWSKVFDSPTQVEQIMYDPQNPEIVYGSVNSIGMIKSTDGGESWNELDMGRTIDGRIEFDISHINPSRIFALSEIPSDGQPSTLFISSDAGNTWGTIQRNGTADNDFLGGQGFYDNTVLCHPLDEDIVFFGGVNLWKAEVSSSDLLDVELDFNENSFLQFVDFGGEHGNGLVGSGNVALSNVPSSIELRFGPGNSQFAHRFSVNGRGSGVPDEDYFYLDYVEVPFEVWDTENNRQLMVSFRDQLTNGSFDLINTQTDSDNTALHSREYIFIHDVTYGTSPNSQIAQRGGQNTGHQFESMYFLWPVLREGSLWLSANSPELTLRLNRITGANRTADIRNLTDAYNEFTGRNRYIVTTGSTTTSGIHPDHHSLEVIHLDSVSGEFQILNGNDGGVYVSNLSTQPAQNSGDWSFVSSGMRTSQFYDADKRPGRMEFFGGMQDNGTWRSPLGQEATEQVDYDHMTSGDGFEVIWNQSDPNLMLSSSQFNFIWRSTDGGGSWTPASGIEEGSDSGPFYTKLERSTNNDQNVFAIGNSGVWRSTNFGRTWSVTRITSNWRSSINSLSSYDVEVSDANDQIVWAGGGMRSTQRIFLSTNGGVSFNTAGFYSTERLGAISGMASHPTQSSTAYLLFSFAESPKILRTNNLGNSWEDISGFEGNTISDRGFPDVAVYCLLVFPDETDRIWVGTEIGLVESNDAGVSWHLVTSNLPSTAIYNMKVVDDVVVVATHGRGIWTFEAGDLLPTIDRMYTDISSGQLVVDATVQVQYDSLVFETNGTPLFRTQEQTPGSLTLRVDLFEDTVINMNIMGYLGANSFSSSTVTLDHIKLNPIARMLTDDFANDDAFFSKNLDLTTEDGFDDNAIHTPHPLSTGGSSSLYLRNPLIIDDDSATVSYDEVLLVENEGSLSSGQLTLEATSNGFDWIALEDPYTSSDRGLWTSALSSGANGTASLFENRLVEISPTFPAGDTVLIRWRLENGLARNQWGWVIDNLNVQSLRSPTSVSTISKTAQVFPNPAISHFTIRLPRSVTTTHYVLRLIDLSGQQNQVIQITDLEKIPLEDIPTGAYFIQLFNDRNQLLAKNKIIIR